MDSKVKQFQFVTFEQWRNNKYRWKQKIGDYYCGIEAVMYGCNGYTENTYKIAISTEENPVNIYSKTIYCEYKICDRKDTDELKKWYEEITVETNKKFKQYILEKYFDNPEE